MKTPVFCLIFCLGISITFASHNPKPDLENRQQYNSIILGLLPATDVSGFKGKWKLSKGIPGYISRYLSNYFEICKFDKIYKHTIKNKMPGKAMFSIDELKSVSDEFNLNYLIYGKIEKFFIHKSTAGIGSLGGAKHYLGIIHYKLMIYNSQSHSIVLKKEISIRKQQPLVRINYYKLSDDEDQYLRLNNTEFGSALYDSTIAGSITKELCERIDKEIQNQIRIDYKNSNIPGKLPINKENRVKIARIVSFGENDSGTVYINAGFNDNIYINQKFEVFDVGKEIKDPETGMKLGNADIKVGLIEVDFIKASHFSKARVIKSTSPIKQGNYIYIRQ
ncbi:MAG: hypothetical protein ABIA63_11840 [bacterium]